MLFPKKRIFHYLPIHNISKITKNAQVSRDFVCDLHSEHSIKIDLIRAPESKMEVSPKRLKWRKLEGEGLCARSLIGGVPRRGTEYHTRDRVVLKEVYLKKKLEKQTIAIWRRCA